MFYSSLDFYETQNGIENLLFLETKRKKTVVNYVPNKVYHNNESINCKLKKAPFQKKNSKVIKDLL